MLGTYLAGVRERAPLVHNITNAVTTNDCANILHALGASPIMADEPLETAAVTARCDATTINIGTPSAAKTPGMQAAGMRANELGHPVVLDPVGAGISPFRTELAAGLLRDVRFHVIRGNMSEIRTLANLLQAKETGTEAQKSDIHGVDEGLADHVTEENLPRAAAFVRDFARRAGTVCAVTGAIDIIADADHAYAVRNGSPYLRRITGAGCMLSCLTSAFLAAFPEDPLGAACAAACTMGVCGEMAAERLTERDGNGTFRAYLLDAVCTLTPEELDKRARIEEVRA